MRPLVCNYYLTFRCNDTCEFCPIWQDKQLQSIQEAGIEPIKQNLREMKDMGVLVMNFTGGEPLLREDLSEILKASKRLGFFNVLTTNGIEYAPMAKQISGFVDHLVFSLDSPSAAEHDRIRGVSCYDSVIESIKIAKSLYRLPIINFTVTRDSVQSMPDMVDLAQKLGVLLWINPVYNWSGLEGFDRESVDYIARYIGMKNVGVNLASLELVKKRGNNIRRPVCLAGARTITIFPDDTLVSPCFYIKRSAPRIEGHLASIIKGKEVRAAISLHGRDNMCKGCMDWSYMNPSFLHGISKNSFLALYSVLKMFRKELSLKKGERI